MVATYVAFRFRQYPDLTLTVPGYEVDEEGEAAPIEEQHPSYKAICNKADPDNDGEDECASEIPPPPE